MLALLLGWWGISLIGAGLIAGALVAAWFGLRWLAYGLGVAAAAYIYSGIIFQEGEWACEQRVLEAERVEAQRVQAANDRADDLEDQLRAARATINQLLDERQADAEAEIVAEDEAEQAEAAASGAPAPVRCIDSQRDIDRLYDLLR